jgi:hypothetical protein
MNTDRKEPIRHRVVSHVRDNHHVRSYVRGDGEKPQTPFFMNKPKPVTTTLSNPLLEKVEELVDNKIKIHQDAINTQNGSYWTKISKFQLDYNGKTWNIIRSYDNGGGKNSEDCQLCGHKHCRYMFVISSGASQLTIGSECVGNYTKDINAKDILKHFQNNVVKKSAKIASYRDALINIGLWVNKNGSNSFLTSIVGQMLEGKDLTARQLGAVDKIISKDIDRSALDVKDKITTIFGKAKQKITNDWERTFIVSIGDQLQKGRTLSPKQVAKLEQMANR